MSTHPNAILALVLTPDGTTRKTYRGMMEKYHSNAMEGFIKVTGLKEACNITVMEDDYDKGYQIKAKEGDIVVFSFVTYGYGQTIGWDDLVKQKAKMEEWAKVVCEEFQCNYRFMVTASYW